MVSEIVKFLPQFITPLAIVAALLFFSLFLIYNHPKGAIWLVLISLLIVAVFGNAYFSTYFTRSMEWRHMPPSETPKADAIVLLAGGALPADSPRQSVEVSAEGDREFYAARLYAQGAAPVILVSGGQAEVASARALLESLGVPAEAILTQDKSLNAEQDAEFSKVLITEKGYKSIILVTSALYMDRAYTLFKEAAETVTPAPTDFTVTLAEWESLMKWDVKTILSHLMPTSSAFQQTSVVLREYLSLLVYRLKLVF